MTTRTPGRMAATLAAVTATMTLGLAATTPAAATPSKDGYDLAATAKYKKAITALVAGTYSGGQCLIGKDIQLGPGTIKFGADGVMQANGRSDDVTRLPTSSFGIVVHHGDSQLLAYRVDVTDPKTGDRPLQFSVSTLVDGSLTTGIATDETSGRSTGCPGARKSGFDLWAVANTYIAFAKTSLHCVDSRNAKLTTATALFSSSKIVIGDFSIDAQAPRAQEQLEVDDSKAEFVYGLYDMAGDQVLTTIGADGKLASIQVMRASDLSLFGCSP